MQVRSFFSVRSYLRLFAAFVLFGAVSIESSIAAQKVILNEADFRDRIYACWLGKNIGGTLGMPFEGKKEMNSISFYTNLKKGEPAANDDLDLQILWLKAMEDNGGRVDARILGEYWLKYVPVDWNEYGVGKANMKLGWLPPLSGEYNNEKWKHSNGAWIRSEIWACLAPGCPALAARMAREDACVDHGAAEGTLAEIFTASLESAAFLESDREKLIAYGLSMIPEDCRVARAVHTAVQAKKDGKDWQNARLAVIGVTEDTGWFQAPRNVAFMIIGWLYGDDDFGKSISTAVNCGDDTDCTAATLGSILGIIGGSKAIPAQWREPIGEKIKTVAVAGFPIPEDINALTDRTLAMTKKVLALHNAPVEVTAAPSVLSGAGSLLVSGPKEARSLWSLSPYRIVWNETDFRVTLDYVSDPVIRPGLLRSIQVTVENQSGSEKLIRLELQGLPKSWKIHGLPSGTIKLGKSAAQSFPLTIAAPELAPGLYSMKLSVTGAEKLIIFPLTFISPKS
jgi:ADP-ribosylglycohydrolase